MRSKVFMYNHITYKICYVGLTDEPVYLLFNNFFLSIVMDKVVGEVLKSDLNTYLKIIV